MANIEVVFEDEFLLVINKPSGIVVNRANSVKGETVQDWAKVELKINKLSSYVDTTESRELIRQEKEDVDWDEVNRQVFYDRAGIVHRLDKETSGVLVLAKNEDVFVELLRQFREREVQKVYLALVHGYVDKDEDLIDEAVGRLPWNRTRFGVLPGGRRAVTRYRKILNIKYKISKRMEFFTLLELKPETGRTHQIRVHMKHLGHPVVGDQLYAGRKTARRDRRWCPRLFLHAWKLEIEHPKSLNKMEFRADLTEDLNKVIKELSDGKGLELL